MGGRAITGIRTRDLPGIKQKLFCCATQEQLFMTFDLFLCGMTELRLSCKYIFTCNLIFPELSCFFLLLQFMLFLLGPRL